MKEIKLFGINGLSVYDIVEIKRCIDKGENDKEIKRLLDNE